MKVSHTRIINESTSQAGIMIDSFRLSLVELKRNNLRKQLKALKVFFLQLGSQREMPNEAGDFYFKPFS